ncbi:hypothetical protein Hdeb2414_s0004g00140951 [Helianthus debilis subsp. tardiflorus]
MVNKEADIPPPHSHIVARVKKIDRRERRRPEKAVDDGSRRSRRCFSAFSDKTSPWW